MDVRRSSPPLQAAREAAAAAAARRAAGRRSDRRRCRTSYCGMPRPLSCTPQHIIHLLPPTAYHMTAYSHASIRSPCSTPLAPRSASARQDRRVRNCIKQKNCIARGHRAVCAENQDGDTGSFPNDCVSKREGGAAVFCGILRAGQLVLWHFESAATIIPSLSAPALSCPSTAAAPTGSGACTGASCTPTPPPNTASVSCCT